MSGPGTKSRDGRDGADQTPAPGRKPDLERLLKHSLGFLFSGGLAFCVDAAMLQLLMALFDLDPIVARIGSISVAMIAGWLSHRRFTFRVSAPPSLAEFLRYAAVAWFSAAVNYAVFVAVLIVWPETMPIVALVIAAGVAMFVSYVGMRFAAFRRTGLEGTRPPARS